VSRFTAIRERLLSPVGMHAVGFAVLAIATIVLGIRVGLDWQETSGSNMDAVAGRRAELATLQLQTAPLRGLDKKVELSREQIDEFYGKRIPPSYSAFLDRLGQLQSKSQVKLARVAYTQAPGSGDLTEIRMDAGVSGDYRAIMHFVNGLERNETFFVIRAMALSGQQSGTVNLRLQVSTWLRPKDAAAFPVEGKAASGTEPGSATPASTTPGIGIGGEGL
jgi:type IV pilus assembly protein PilO